MFKLKPKTVFSFILIIIFIQTIVSLNNTEEDFDKSDEHSDDNSDHNSYDIERHGSGEGSDEEEDDDDEYQEDPGECTPLEVVKNLNFSDFLPDDFEELKTEPMVKIVPRWDDTWDRFLRVFKFEHKLYANKDLKELFNYFVGIAYELSYDIKLEPDCMVAMSKLLTALLNEEIWAFKFIDSQAHPLPSGFWGGVISTFGEYDQCLDIRSSWDESEAINGQYCMLKTLLPYPLTETYDPTFEDNVFATKLRNFTKKYGFEKYSEVNPILKIVEYLNMRKGKFFEFGICIPDKCDPKDIEKEINRLIYPILRIPVEINDTTCRVRDESIRLDYYQIFSISFFCLMTLLVILSTLYELFDKFIGDNPDNKHSILITFSAILNTNKLLKERTDFSSVNTIKLLISIWFIGAHTYFFTAHSFVLKRFNYSVPLQLFYENRYFFVRAKQLGVDSLMVASGLLVSHKLIGTLEKSSGKFSYVNYIIIRWLKLSVPLFAAILFYYLLPLIGSGPIWNECDGYFQPGCKDWSIILSNFLYFSNFNILSAKYFFGICVHMTWFLSSNFQLCLIAPALVICLFKYPKFGIKLNILLILSAILLTVSPYIVFQINTYYEITRLSSFRALRFSIFSYHMNTLQYVGSFAIGLLTGYAIKYKKEISIPGFNVHDLYLCLTTLSILTLPLVMMWNNTLNLFNDSPSELNAILFFGLGKFFWSASLAWIWYVCCTGRADKLNKILSLRFVQPFTRLTTLIYLVHLPVIFYRIYSIRQTYIMTDWLTLQNIYIDVSVTVVLSYILYLLVVSPFENIIKYLGGNNRLIEEIRVDHLTQVFTTNGQKPMSAVEDKLNNNEEATT